MSGARSHLPSKVKRGEESRFRLAQQERRAGKRATLDSDARCPFDSLLTAIDNGVITLLHRFSRRRERQSRWRLGATQVTAWQPHLSRLAAPLQSTPTGRGAAELDPVCIYRCSHTRSSRDSP